MKRAPLTFLIGLLFCSYTLVLAQDNNRIQPSDLAVLIGNWEGSLTYLSYQDNTPYTLKTNLAISAGENESEIQVDNSYPDEPQANGTYYLRIKKKGARLNRNPIHSRTVLADGTIEIVTQSKGRDDNNKAIIRITYLIGQDSYKTRKEVQFRGETDWIKRNEFTYTRV